MQSCIGFHLGDTSGDENSRCRVSRVVEVEDDIPSAD
jgi:hypothetical protein